jgi:hypothetical protein
MYQQIGGVSQPETLNRGGLARINIPDSSPDSYPDGPEPKKWKGEWTTLTNPEEIARHTGAAKSWQYYQAATPLLPQFH